MVARPRHEGNTMFPAGSSLDHPGSGHKGDAKLTAPGGLYSALSPVVSAVPKA